MEKREKLYHRLNFFFVLFYLSVSIILAAYYASSGQSYYSTLGICGPLLLLLPTVLERIMGFRPAYQLHFLIYLFSFFAYVVGLVMQAYQYTPYYDKIIHALSGVLGMSVGVLLFYALKPGRTVQKSDFPLVAVFSFSVSMTVACLWEIGEYLVGQFFPCDPQRVLTTGVADTMQDIIVCLFGSLFFIPSLVRYYRQGKSTLLMGGLLAFFEKNLTNREP